MRTRTRGWTITGLMALCLAITSLAGCGPKVIKVEDTGPNAICAQMTTGWSPDAQPSPVNQAGDAIKKVVISSMQAGARGCYDTLTFEGGAKPADYQLKYLNDTTLEITVQAPYAGQVGDNGAVIMESVPTQSVIESVLLNKNDGGRSVFVITLAKLAPPATKASPLPKGASPSPFDARRPLRTGRITTGEGVRIVVDIVTDRS